MLSADYDQRFHPACAWEYVVKNSLTSMLSSWLSFKPYGACICFCCADCFVVLRVTDKRFCCDCRIKTYLINSFFVAIIR